MTENEKAFWYQKFTVQGRIFFPALLQPEANRNGRVQYSCLFAWKFGSNEAETKRIGQFLAKMKQDYFPTIPEQFLLNPVKKWGQYVRQDGKPNHSFLQDCYWINLSSGMDFPPPVVDKFRNQILDKEEVYSGRNAVVSFSFYKADKEKKGAGANLNAVMLMEGGNKEGGSATVNLQEIFGAFSSDMGTPTGSDNNGGTGSFI